MARRQAHEEHENHERWLVSYADFITLLFAFFVVMYSVSSVDQKRIVQAEKSVRWAMHFKGSGGTNEMPLFLGAPGGAGLISNGAAQGGQDRKLKSMENIRRRVERNLKPFIETQEGRVRVLVELDERGLILRLSAAHFFDRSEAALRPEVFPVLDAIAEELMTLGRPMRVEGHTDDTPVGNGRFRDNWELSASRAASVLAYLQSAHQAPARMLS